VARVAAIAFDFNGTLSDDEPVLCGIFRSLFRELGRPLSDQEYYGMLAGLSDEAIVTTWLGDDYPRIGDVVAERIRRYRELVADGSAVRCVLIRSRKAGWTRAKSSISRNFSSSRSCRQLER
jgi:beta-phosphoglucomutase